MKMTLKEAREKAIMEPNFDESNDVYASTEVHGNETYVGAHDDWRTVFNVPNSCWHYFHKEFCEQEYEMSWDDFVEKRLIGRLEAVEFIDAEY